MNSAANAMPLTAPSYQLWSDKAPRAVLEEHKINYKDYQDTFSDLFIDEKCFGYLANEEPPDNEHVPEFWKHRADLIASDLIMLTKIQTPESE